MATGVTVAGQACSAQVVYVGFYWADYTQNVEFQFASHVLSDVVRAVSAQLTSLSVNEDGYQEFLLQRIAAWEGTDSHVTTTSNGKLVMLALPLQSHGAT